MPVPNIFGGPLPLQPVAPVPFAGSPGGIQSAYNSAYGAARATNEALYGQILGGYQQTAAAQRSAQDALAAGYGNLSGGVLGGVAGGAARQQGVAGWYGDTLGEQYGRQSDIDQRYGDLSSGVQTALNPLDQTITQMAGRDRDLTAQYGDLTRRVMGDVYSVGQSQRMDIQAAYARQSAQAQQNLVSRGIANSTVASAVQRGSDFDATRANIDLSDRLAQLRASYGSQLGQAALGFQERALGNEVGQANLSAQTRAGYLSGIGQAALGFRERAGQQQVAQANLQTGANLDLLRQQQQMQAAYGTQIGLAGLGQQGQDVAQNTALAGRQLDWMNTVQAGYPDPSLYANLALAAGQASRRVPDVSGLAAGGGGLLRAPSTGRGLPTTPLAQGGPDLGGRGGFTPGYGSAFNATPLNAGVGAGPVNDAFGNVASYFQSAEPGGNPYSPGGGMVTGGGAPAGPYSESQGDAYGGAGAYSGAGGYAASPYGPGTYQGAYGGVGASFQGGGDVYLDPELANL